MTAQQVLIKNLFKTTDNRYNPYNLVAKKSFFTNTLSGKKDVMLNSFQHLKDPRIEILKQVQDDKLEVQDDNWSLRGGESL